MFKCRWKHIVPVLLVAALTTAGSVAFAEEPSAKAAYPLWDGQESVADYAKKVNLPPTKTLDFGNGVKMELVLIPAGKFLMGTPEHEEPAETVAVGQGWPWSYPNLTIPSIILTSLRSKRGDG